MLAVGIFEQSGKHYFEYHEIHVHGKMFSLSKCIFISNDASVPKRIIS